MIKILITGGTGFIAQRVIKKFTLNPEYQFTLITRNKNFKLKNNQHHRIIYCANFFNKDLTWYKSILNGIDIVIHNAWYTNHNDYLTSNHNLDCLKGSKIFFDAISMSKIKKLISFGTCFEYKFTNKKLSINSKLEPINLYSLSKKFLYDYGKLLFSKNKIKFLWCRLFFVYGLGEPKTKLYSSLLLNLSKNKKFSLSNGNQIRDFIHIDDVATKLKKVIVNNKNSTALNICSGNGISVKRFAQKIAKKHGKENLLIFGKKSLNFTDPHYVVGVDNVK
jgi:nucleoside-diphosphate-sugar epimerase